VGENVKSKLILAFLSLLLVSACDIGDVFDVNPVANDATTQAFLDDLRARVPNIRVEFSDQSSSGDWIQDLYSNDPDKNPRYEEFMTALSQNVSAMATMHQTQTVILWVYKTPDFFSTSVVPPGMPSSDPAMQLPTGIPGNAAILEFALPASTADPVLTALLDEKNGKRPENYAAIALRLLAVQATQMRAGARPQSLVITRRREFPAQDVFGWPEPQFQEFLNMLPMVEEKAMRNVPPPKVQFCSVSGAISPDTVCVNVKEGLAELSAFVNQANTLARWLQPVPTGPSMNPLPPPGPQLPPSPGIPADQLPRAMEEGGGCNASSSASPLGWFLLSGLLLLCFAAARSKGRR
jgi:hypothetical protein